VLETTLSSISSALDKRIESYNALEPLKKQRQEDGLSPYIQETIQILWHDRIRISPKKKHVCYF
jgi:hypothetical protein